MAFTAFVLLKEIKGQINEGYFFSADAESLLKAPLVQDFTCDGREYGYYADVANNCQVFHLCWPVPPTEEGAPAQTFMWSFICPNQTIFDQAELVCNHEFFAFPCEEAETVYGAVEYFKTDSEK